MHSTSASDISVGYIATTGGRIPGRVLCIFKHVRRFKVIAIDRQLRVRMFTLGAVHCLVMIACKLQILCANWDGS